MRTSGPGWQEPGLCLVWLSAGTEEGVPCVPSIYGHFELTQRKPEAGMMHLWKQQALIMREDAFWNQKGFINLGLNLVRQHRRQLNHSQPGISLLQNVWFSSLFCLSCTNHGVERHQPLSEREWPETLGKFPSPANGTHVAWLSECRFQSRLLITHLEVSRECALVPLSGPEKLNVAHLRTKKIYYQSWHWTQKSAHLDSM